MDQRESRNRGPQACYVGASEGRAVSGLCLFVCVPRVFRSDTHTNDKKEKGILKRGRGGRREESSRGLPGIVQILVWEALYCIPQTQKTLGLCGSGWLVEDVGTGPGHCLHLLLGRQRLWTLIPERDVETTVRFANGKWLIFMIETTCKL